MAVQDYFLKLDGINGESQDSKHKNEIEIYSWSFGISNRGSAAKGGGMGQGKVQMYDVAFVKNVDAASPKLMLACAQGQHIKSAVLTCRKAGKEQQEYLKLTLSDVLVSSFHNGLPDSYSFSGTGDQSPVPSEKITLNYDSATVTETFSLNFTKVEFEYKEQKADGTLGGAIKTHYDIKQQQGG
jgi:type VI secretion system secreted protein Hcp